MESIPYTLTEATPVETIIGNRRHFDAEDVFFSSTDDKGVIRSANETFLQLARYPREEMIGAPHNIIRHDDMPGGLFKLMWDDLTAGRPVGAYVLNRAKDGLDYWVFATVTPTSSGYVSVRTKPLDDAVFATIGEVYGRVRAAERERMDSGANRREAAEHGAGLLAEELASLGYDTLAAFGRASLASEAQRLLAEGVRVPVREEAEGPAAEILCGARRVEASSDSLVDRIGDFREVVSALGSWLDGAESIRDRARRTAALMRTLTSKDPESSAPGLAERIIERSERAATAVTGLKDSVASFADAMESMAFSAALIRLHTLVLGAYAASVVDGAEADAPTAMRELVQGLEADLGSLDSVRGVVETRIGELESAMASVVSDLDRTRRPYDRWLRALTDEGGVLIDGAEGDVEALMKEAGSLSEQGYPEMSDLANLAGRYRGLDLSTDDEALGGAVERIRAALAELD